MRDIMERLRLTVNEEKPHVRHVPDAVNAPIWSEQFGTAHQKHYPGGIVTLKATPAI